MRFFGKMRKFSTGNFLDSLVFGLSLVSLPSNPAPHLAFGQEITLSVSMVLQ